MKNEARGGDGDGEVSVAEDVFLDLLPRVDDLAELKLLLHVIYLAAGRGTPGVPLGDLLAGPVLRSVVGTLSPEPGEQRLRRTLDRATANGSLLRVAVGSGDQSSVQFLPGTRRNRELLEQLRAAEPEARRELGIPLDAETVLYRPNVFAFYEQHIGTLTPLLAEQLRDAERSYPRAWIEEAIMTAVHYNKRNWRYIQTILTRWEETGGPNGVSRKGS